MPKEITMLTTAQRTLFRRVFSLAAAYNLAWGLLMIAFPRVPFRCLGISLGQPDTMAVQFWQCIGMFVMVFAVGYAPFALVGLLGKLFGPIGFLWGWHTGTMPGRMVWINVTNDLIWLPFFVPFVWWTMFAPPDRSQT